MNRNQESIEQLKRLTQAAKNFYGNNYSPGFISHRNDVRHYLGEEYIPYDWGDDIDNPVNDEYKNVYLNKNPNYDFTPKTQNLMQTPKPMQQTTQFQAPKPQTMQNQSTGLMPKQKLKGFGYYTTGSGSATITFPSSFGNGANMQKGSSVIKPKNVNKHPISNNDPYYDLKNHLINEEGNYNHMYLGKVGDLTHCVGHYDETEEETLTHPWVYKKTDIPASREDIIKNRNNILSKPANYVTNWYKKYTNIELPDEYCYTLLDNDIKSRDRELLRGIPNYSKMDSNMKQGLLEPHFTSNILNWPNLRKAATAKDRDWVCAELHRDETGRPDLIDRNKWSYDKCMQGGFVK